MNRRKFLSGVAAAPAGLMPAVPQRPSPGRAGQREAFVGIQMGPHSLLDEGIERCLDGLRENAGINALLVYSHTYYSGDGIRAKRSPPCLAPDHGIPVRDLNRRKLPFVWVKTHEEYYRNTVLRHRAPGRDTEYAGRDLFAEVLQPCRKRGMKLYARILEPYTAQYTEVFPDWGKVLAADIYGRPGPVTCYHNPDYRAWWLGTVEDLFRSYELDGFQWGGERVGPLSSLVNAGTVPFCFCEHCRARGRREGIDPERARRGFEELYRFVQAVGQQPKPAGGVLAGVMSLFFQYPEILAWERLWRRGKEELFQQMYEAVKAIRPDADVGQHVAHAGSTYDLFYRSVYPYREMASHHDFIKPILYHDILGPRVRWWYLDRLQKGILAELSLEQSLDLFYAFKGYDKSAEPRLDDLDKTGFSPEYVYRETKSIVDGVEGKCKVYSGIGLDVPWNNRRFPSDPEKVYRAVRRAFDAGAGGVLISREYDEMRVPNLKAVGRAVRELRA